ncbi:MAG: DUF3795 domain-containing protein [Christensenellaceae bacterium]
MEKSICGANCTDCPMKKSCKGCVATNGCPNGKQCFIAKYIRLGGLESYKKFKDGLIDEINSLNIEGMPPLKELNALIGEFVNLEYALPNGRKVRFLNDDSVYLGNQLECEFDSDSCFGIVAGMDFILVCTYGRDGKNPELVAYKKR